MFRQLINLSLIEARFYQFPLQNKAPIFSTQFTQFILSLQSIYCHLETSKFVFHNESIAWLPHFHSWQFSHLYRRSSYFYLILQFLVIFLEQHSLS